MKALQEKQWLGVSASLGAISVADGHRGEVAPAMDYSDLALPPYLRCASSKCRAAQTCTIGLSCITRPSEGVTKEGKTWNDANQ